MAPHAFYAIAMLLVPASLLLLLGLALQAVLAIVAAVGVSRSGSPLDRRRGPLPT